MCELIYVNSHNMTLNRFIAILVALEDSRKLNLDGWGIFTQSNGIFKHVEDPWKTFAFGQQIRKMVTDDSPILMHVRQASRGSDVKVEYNHPFETDNLVLAHNGTLELKKDNDKYKEMMDSQIFLAHLDREYSKSPNVVKALQATMESFYGSFAFLIYEKRTKRYFAVRGNTKLLHISNIIDRDDKVYGYVINTSSEDLSKGADTGLEMNTLIGEKQYLLSIPTLLESNSIFLLEKLKVTKVGDIVENTKPYQQTTRAAYLDPAYWERPAGLIPASNPGGINFFAENVSYVRRLLTWIKLYGLSIEDLDEILFQTLGDGILSCLETDIQTLLRHILPKMQCKRYVRENYIKSSRHLEQLQLFPIYEKGRFQYPYILEQNSQDLIKAIEEYNNELCKK